MSPTLRVSGTHLVTGGLGGLGAQLALRLADAGADHLVLVVKHQLPERHRWDMLSAEGADFARVGIVRELEAAGAKVTVAALDLSDESSLVKLFSSLDFATLPLRGVWHTAMSFSSGALAELDAEAVRTMIKVKSITAWRLHELSRAHRLDYFVMFSSTTALWGAAELAHYAAANAFLDALAHFRRIERLPATVINWGIWRQMSGLPTLAQDRAARVGMRPMPASAALAALGRVLVAGVSQMVVADVDWQIFKPVYESRRQRPFLERIVPESVTSSLLERNDRTHPLIEHLATAAADERRDLLARHLHQALAAVLGAGTDDFIDRRKGFFDLGMDSLTSVQFRRGLENDLGRRLPTTLTFSYPTVDLLADYLFSELFPNVRPPAAATPSTVPYGPVTPERAVESNDDLDATEEELFEQLAARLLHTRT